MAGSLFAKAGSLGSTQISARASVSIKDPFSLGRLSPNTSSGGDLGLPAAAPLEPWPLALCLQLQTAGALEDGASQLPPPPQPRPVASMKDKLGVQPLPT